MDNSLKTDETIDTGVKRIYSGLLEETKSMVMPPRGNIHDTIHNARKSFKFIRALHRLVKSPLGTEQYEKENYAFRDLARLVSILRDLHVLIIMLQYVASEAHSVRRSDISGGLELLERREQKALEKALDEEKRFEKIEWGLISANKRVEDWPEIPDSIQALLPGVGEVYTRGRVGYQQAKEVPEKDHFHEWRKQVKYLLHHFEILTNYWPDELGINGTSLQQLSDYLGEEHDLAMLDDLLEEDSFSNTLSKIEALRTYVDQKRSFLQRSALNLGGFIYTKSADEFITCFTESENV